MGICLEVILNSPGTEFELMWNQCGNIYQVYYNLSISQVEISINEGIIFGLIIIFLLKKDISYLKDGKQTQSCAMLISTFH